MKSLIDVKGRLTGLQINDNGLKFTQMITDIDQCNELSKDSNQYYIIGETEENIKKTPLKEEMTGSHAVFADIDLNKDGDYVTKRQALLSYIRDNKWEVLPKPTIAVDTGNGVQLLWIIHGPVNSKAIEDTNRWIVDRINGDNVDGKNDKGFHADKACININRLFRLPNTWNHPRDNKLVMGAPKGGSITKLLWDTGITHDIIDMAQKADPNINRDPIIGSDLNDAEEIEANDDYTEFLYKKMGLLLVPQHWMVYIKNFNRPKEWISNVQGESEYIHQAMIVLVTAKISQKDIAIIAYSDYYKWSEWWINKDKTKTARLKRIKREYDKASLIVNRDKDNELAGELTKMNDDYAILDEGYSFRIIREDQPDKPYKICPLGAWTLATKDRYITSDKGKIIQLSDEWLRWSGHRKYSTLAFNAKNDYEYELFRGWGVDVPDVCDPIISKALDDFMLNSYPDDKQREFFINQVAYWTQNIGTVTGKMPLLFGQKGCGKSFLGSLIYNMFSDYAVKTDVSKSLGRFTGHLENKLLVFFDEMSVVNKESGDRLKDLITASVINIEDKAKTARNAINYANYIGTIDDQRYIYGEQGERRVYIMECSNHYNISIEESRLRFEDFLGVMGIVGRHKSQWTRMGDIISFFLNRKIPKINFDETFSSDVMDNQIEKKLPTLYKFFLDYFQNGIRSSVKMIHNQHQLKNDVMTVDFIIEAIKMKYNEDVSRREISRFMEKVLLMDKRPSNGIALRWVFPEDMNIIHKNYKDNGGIDI